MILEHSFIPPMSLMHKTLSAAPDLVSTVDTPYIPKNQLTMSLPPPPPAFQLNTPCSTFHNDIAVIVKKKQHTMPEMQLTHT